MLPQIGFFIPNLLTIYILVQVLPQIAILFNDPGLCDVSFAYKIQTLVHTLDNVWWLFGYAIFDVALRFSGLSYCTCIPARYIFAACQCGLLHVDPDQLFLLKFRLQGVCEQYHLFPSVCDLRCL